MISVIVYWWQFMKSLCLLKYLPHTFIEVEKNKLKISHILQSYKCSPVTSKKKKILCSHGKIKFYPHAYFNIIFLLFILSLNVHISPNSHLWIWISFCLNFLFSCDIYFPLWLSSLLISYLVSYFHIWFQIKFIVIFILPFLTIIRHYFGYFQLAQLPWKTWE